MKKILAIFFTFFALTFVRAEDTADLQMCNYANRQNTGEAWKNYLINFPKGACAAIAESELQKRGISLPVKNNNNAKINSQDQRNCDFARSKNTLYAWKAYIKEYPKGVCHFEAKIRISELEADAARRASAKPKPEPKPEVIELQWSEKSANKMRWDEAIYYCENLQESGFSDWEMPTINELRNLIKNCSQTKLDGSCPVSNSYVKMIDSSKCGNVPVCSCSKSNMGIYSIYGDKEGIWSSTPAEIAICENTAPGYAVPSYHIVKTDYETYAWIVDFEYGSIVFREKSYRSNKVRCVRKSR